MSGSSAVRLILFSIVLCFTSNIVEISGQKVVSVRIKTGLINGRVETIVGKKLNVFRGIPYAQPPINRLRFKKPLPISKFKKPVNAFQFQSVCPQDVKRFDVGDYFINKNVSEDCLYLNVWSPVSNRGEDVLKPVMFWIHGGGLLVGNPSEEYYQGDILAAKGDVVVVSVAYRLNILGFLYTGTDDAPGNVGLWDQALALKWVHDNIKYFSGDPHRVTIFGESAGGWSTSLHIISPVSRHLFKNAIVNSGAFVYRFTEHRPKDHIKKWLRGVKKIGCSDDGFPGVFTRKIMNCLRNIDISKLILVTDFGDITVGTVKVFDFVVADGEFLPTDPSHMLEHGDFKQNVNLMISTVEDEGSFLINNFNDPKRFHSLRPYNMSYSESYSYLRDMSSGMNSELPINGEDVAKLYFMGLSDNNGYDLLRRTMGIAVGDYFLTCSTLFFAEEVYRKSNFRANVYQYYFNSKFQTNFFCSYWMGVCHTNDIFPMFGIPFLDPKNYNDREREISVQMIQFLTDFAKTGYELDIKLKLHFLW